MSRNGPSSTNGTIDNDKKIKQLVEPIEIYALEETEYLSRGSYLLFVSAQDETLLGNFSGFSCFHMLG